MLVQTFLLQLQSKWLKDLRKLEANSTGDWTLEGSWIWHISGQHACSLLLSLSLNGYGQNILTFQATLRSRFCTSTGKLSFYMLNSSLKNVLKVVMACTLWTWEFRLNLKNSHELPFFFLNYPSLLSHLPLPLSLSLIHTQMCAHTYTHIHTFLLMLHHSTGTVPGRRKMIQARGEFVKYTLERFNHVNYYD